VTRGGQQQGSVLAETRQGTATLQHSSDFADIKRSPNTLEYIYAMLLKVVLLRSIDGRVAIFLRRGVVRRASGRAISVGQLPTILPIKPHEDLFKMFQTTPGTRPRLKRVVVR